MDLSAVRVAVLAIFPFLGLLLIEGGPTGNVVGVTTQAGSTQALVGLLIVAVAGLLLAGEVEWQHQKRESAERQRKETRFRVA